MVNNLHKRYAIGLRLVGIEQIKLGGALAVKIAQHDTGFHVTVPVCPKAIERLGSHANNVARVAGGNTHSSGSLIAIESFTISVWAGTQKHANLTAILSFLP